MGFAALISPLQRWCANVGWFLPRRRAATGPLTRHSGRDDASTSKVRRARAATSAHVRPAHQFEGRLDVPPGFGFFVLALLFQHTRFLRGLGHGLVAVCLQQLPGVVVDFDFLHSHGVMLLSSNATGTAERAQERQPLTPNKTCKSYLSAVSRPPQGGIGPSRARPDLTRCDARHRLKTGCYAKSVGTAM